MPGTLEAPAPATDVTTIAPSSAVQNRDARNPRRETSPDRNRAGRDKLNAVARDMAAKKFQTGAQPIQDTPASTTPSPEVSTTPSPAAEAKASTPAKETPAVKAPTAEEKAAAAEKSKKVSAAKRALALDGWKPERIAKFDEEELIEIGAHRAKNQADVNREFDRLKKSATSPTGVRNEDGTFAPKAETKAEIPEAKPESVAKPVVAAAPAGDVDDVLTKEEEAEIGEVGSRLFKRQAATHKAEMAKIRAELKGQGEIGNALSTEMVYSGAAARIEEQHPGKMDNENFGEFVETLKAYIGSGRFGQGELNKAIDSAIYTTYGPPNIVEKHQREMLARQNAADIGQVDSGRGDTTTNTTTEPAKISNPRDALRVAAKMFADNPKGDLEDMRTKLMSKVKVSGR